MVVGGELGAFVGARAKSCGGGAESGDHHMEALITAALNDALKDNWSGSVCVDT